MKIKTINITQPLEPYNISIKNDNSLTKWTIKLSKDGEKVFTLIQSTTTSSN